MNRYYYRAYTARSIQRQRFFSGRCLECGHLPAERSCEGVGHTEECPLSPYSQRVAERESHLDSIAEARREG